MKKNGFITSALLYGILALFLVLMLSSLAVLANRKMSMDTLKEAALNDVGSASGISGFYNIWRTDGFLEEAGGYANNSAGLNGTWETNSTTPYFIFSTGSYQNISGVYLNLTEPVKSDMTVTVYYSDTKEFTDYQRVIGTLTTNSSSISFSFTNGNHKYIRLQIGNQAGLTYQINEISLIVQKDEN